MSAVVNIVKGTGVAISATMLVTCVCVFTSNVNKINYSLEHKDDPVEIRKIDTNRYQVSDYRGYDTSDFLTRKMGHPPAAYEVVAVADAQQELALIEQKVRTIRFLENNKAVVSTNTSHFSRDTMNIRLQND